MRSLFKVPVVSYILTVTSGTVQHQLGTKTLTPQQIQILRHQALLKQQQLQQQRLKLSQGVTAAGASLKTVTATPLITSVTQASQLSQAARLQVRGLLTYHYSRS